MKRRVANRESARRVRQKRQDALCQTQERLQAMHAHASAVATQLLQAEAERVVLAQQVAEMSQKLQAASGGCPMGDSNAEASPEAPATPGATGRQHLSAPPDVGPEDIQPPQLPLPPSPPAAVLAAAAETITSGGLRRSSEEAVSRLHAAGGGVAATLASRTVTSAAGGSNGGGDGDRRLPVSGIPLPGSTAAAAGAAAGAQRRDSLVSVKPTAAFPVRLTCAAAPPWTLPTAALPPPTSPQPADPWCGAVAAALLQPLPTLERPASPLQRLPGMLDDLAWLDRRASLDLDTLPSLAFETDM